MPREPRRRLDVEMVRRGLASTRSEAHAAIAEGKVSVGGRPATKSGTLVAAADAIAIDSAPRRFVSRGGEKLAAAIDRFAIPVGGRHALDAGASTGGFTDCLLAKGAASVIAADVGYGQLDWRLRNDPRVIVLERTNARDLEALTLPFRPDLVVADLSFISLTTVLPALVGVAEDRADFVLLVKPQFEAGRGEVGRGGVVRDPNVWTEVLARVWGRCVELDAHPLGAMASPLPGPAGNVEFFLHACGGAAPSVERQESIEAAVREGLALRPGDRAGAWA